MIKAKLGLDFQHQGRDLELRCHAYRYQQGKLFVGKYVSGPEMFPGICDSAIDVAFTFCLGGDAHWAIRAGHSLLPGQAEEEAKG